MTKYLNIGVDTIRPTNEWLPQYSPIWVIMYTFGGKYPQFQAFASREMCRIHLAFLYEKLSELKDKDISGVSYEYDLLSFCKNGVETECKIVEITYYTEIVEPEKKAREIIQRLNLNLKDVDK